jgi:hypothetical protein
VKWLGLVWLRIGTESSCEFGIEPSGSIKCYVLTTRDLSSSAQLHRVN